MEATQIDAERFAGNFPNSRKVVANDVLEICKFEEFTSKEKGIRGVSITLKDGTLAHTTAKQPVGYILSEKLDLRGLIQRSNDGAVTLFFKEDRSNTDRTMLKASIFPSGN